MYQVEVSENYFYLIKIGRMIVFAQNKEFKNLINCKNQAKMIAIVKGINNRTPQDNNNYDTCIYRNVVVSLVKQTDSIDITNHFGERFYETLNELKKKVIKRSKYEQMNECTRHANKNYQ